MKLRYLIWILIGLWVTKTILDYTKLWELKFLVQDLAGIAFLITLAYALFVFVRYLLRTVKAHWKA